MRGSDLRLACLAGEVQSLSWMIGEARDYLGADRAPVPPGSRDE